MKSDWKKEFEAEMRRGYAVRLEGNEGQARVCARRAAGAALREFLRRQGATHITTNAYELLHDFLTREDLPDDIRRAARLLVLRVNESFALPVDADLLDEARRLAAWLLPEEID